MAEIKISECKELRKKRVLFKVRVGENFTEYKAVYDGLEIWGKTVGTKENIKDLVKRIISAADTLPENAIRAAMGLANYVVSMASINPSARVVLGGVEVVYGPGDRLKLGAGLYYITDYDVGGSRWRGEVEAVYYGNDGLTVNAVHKVVRRLDFKEVVDAVSLYRELLRVARHAINVSYY
jgi:hypothetical protein